jgi:hypothetical protein
MSQSEDNFKKQITDFTFKMDEAIKMAHTMLEDKLKDHQEELPDDIKQKLAELKKKMGDGNST